MREEFALQINAYLSETFAKIHKFLDELAVPPTIQPGTMMRSKSFRYGDPELVSSLYDIHEHLFKNLATMKKSLDDGQDNSFSIPIAGEEDKDQTGYAFSQAKKTLDQIGTPDELFKRKEDFLKKNKGKKKK